MIHTYSYIETSHNQLHRFVMAFFDRIEFETSEFSNSFYVPDFYTDLVAHHRIILGNAFKEIYEIIRYWPQVDKSKLCTAIKDSNKIKEICIGDVIPTKIVDIPESVQNQLKTLFQKLYEGVLKGNYFTSIYGTREKHYKIFKLHSINNYELCPACGISPLHTYLDDIRDQYDHYLPKDIYPFSSVNFENLVPICRDCNSIEVKGNKDILSFTGRVIFPFEDEHDQIQIAVSIAKNNTDLSEIEWNIEYTSPYGKENEIQAWREIYDIDSRHQTHIRGRIDKWFESFWNFSNKKSIVEKIPNTKDRNETYLSVIESKAILEYQSIKELINSEQRLDIEEKKFRRYI